MFVANSFFEFFQRFLNVLFVIIGAVRKFIEKHLQIKQIVL